MPSPSGGSGRMAKDAATPPFRHDAHGVCQKVCRQQQPHGACRVPEQVARVGIGPFGGDKPGVDVRERPVLPAVAHGGGVGLQDAPALPCIEDGVRRAAPDDGQPAHAASKQGVRAASGIDVLDREVHAQPFSQFGVARVALRQGGGGGGTRSHGRFAKGRAGCVAPFRLAGVRVAWGAAPGIRIARLGGHTVAGRCGLLGTDGCPRTGRLHRIGQIPAYRQSCDQQDQGQKDADGFEDAAWFHDVCSSSYTTSRNRLRDSIQTSARSFVGLFRLLVDSVLP
ncbi:MAG: hypothetical protein LBD12_05705 [Clostridiales Family XIII bacterium]|nr:hypothetical protein [Clostridiales Family XIII bacterium]